MATQRKDDDGLERGRCEDDTTKGFASTLTLGDGTEIVMNEQALAVATAVSAAAISSAAAACQGIPPDFIERVALAVYDTLQLKDDPHTFCTLMSILAAVGMLIQEVVVPTVQEGEVFFEPLVGRLILDEAQQILHKEPPREATLEDEKDDGGGIAGR